jgi:glycosyltransferase involved in cell wall biosynthesis
LDTQLIFPFKSQHLAPVSVVIPCYRCSETIKRAVESIASQSLRPQEVILIDDGSGDDTLSVLFELQRLYGDWIVIEALTNNMGVASARNRGWEVAKQPYIAFLDSDDAWHNQKIEIQYGFMEKNPWIAMTGHGHKRISKSDECLEWVIPKVTSHPISKVEILLSNRFVTPSIILKKNIPFRFSEGKRHMEDHLLWSQIISSGLPVVKLEVDLAAIYKFSYGVAGLSSETRQMQSGEVENYKTLYKDNHITILSLLSFVGLSYVKVIKRILFILLLKLISPTAYQLASYMSLTYSLTGMLIVLGLLGELTIASDVAVVQGAALATFYVLSGDARHLILNGKVQARNIAFFRLMATIPLAMLAYMMSAYLGGVHSLLAGMLIIRRSTEWLAEPHVTEIEKLDGRWKGLVWQVFFFFFAVGDLVYLHQYWPVLLWAVSPITYSLKFLRHAKFDDFYVPAKSNLVGTAIMGISNYALRVLIVQLVGKISAGMLFPAIAIGSFAGTMFANVAGSTIIRKGLLDAYSFKFGLWIWSLCGVTIFLISQETFGKTLGLSMVGSTLMVYAQRERLINLKDGFTLNSDLLVHLILLCIIPLIYYTGGLDFLSAIYLFNALLAWVFYKKDITKNMTESRNIRIFIGFVILSLVVPLFFQIQGQIYNDSGPLGMVDSGGKLSLVPLPISLITSFIGIAFLHSQLKNSMPAILTIAGMFFLLIFSSLAVGHNSSKLILMIQFILPTIGLLLGNVLGLTSRKLVANVFLYFLLAFIPYQLVCSWIQGSLALTHYLYFFSVYQHYQYVPLIISVLFCWSFVELENTKKNLLYILTPLVGMYVAGANSLLALLGVVIFFAAYVIKSVSKQNLIVFSTLLISILCYFSLNSIIATKLPHELVHGVFVGKLFDKDGSELYTNQENSHVPANVTGRVAIASKYIDGILESAQTILVGHASPPPRSEITSGHNYYLDITYNFGIFSILPILLLLVYTTYCYLKQSNKDPSAIWMLSIIIFLILIDNNLKVSLRQPYPGIITFFLWGILISNVTHNKVKFRNE